LSCSESLLIEQNSKSWYVRFSETGFSTLEEIVSTE